ncbi:helix-turn-helix transcriptional regulator [Microlunatus flavus]|uniref:Predicted DNA-binding transcriptional regulator YafY, contains an HTH and WYL domains n=1 Tax=Microlunatus flavus TaxID=1036181 RepID=A0A1H9I3S0_9ACTN|nr:WYL domain-containing protein [Microlunatus flavus]SEQ69244.1 Predicted DNA-binding transcriptional regulator YafY, contains an HTH and WYL domains [Microlunatus flavus]
MSRPTARVLALLEILQSGGTRSAADLADTLGVDPRTVRRYVEHLLDLDVPVESVRGTYGGYRLAPGHRVPPLMFSGEEAVAVLLGLLERAGDPEDPTRSDARRAAGSAASKVRRVLPGPLARQVDALLDVAELSSGDAPVPDETRVLLLVAAAARARRPLEVVHTRDGHERARTVRPYGLVAHHGRWYVCGADSRSGEVRTFRLDRLGPVRLGEGTFAVPTGFDARAAVLASLAATPWRHRVSARVRAPVADVVARLPPGLGAVNPDATPGWARVEVRVESLDWVPALLAGLAADLGADLVVEAPDELRERVHALGRRLLDA